MINDDDEKYHYFAHKSKLENYTRLSGYKVKKNQLTKITVFKMI